MMNCTQKWFFILSFAIGIIPHSCRPMRLFKKNEIKKILGFSQKIVFNAVQKPFIRTYADDTNYNKHLDTSRGNKQHYYEQWKCSRQWKYLRLMKNLGVIVTLYFAYDLYKANKEYREKCKIKDLYKYIKENDIDAVKLLLKKNSDLRVDESSGEDKSPLQVVDELGRQEIFLAMMCHLENQLNAYDTDGSDMLSRLVHYNNNKTLACIKTTDYQSLALYQKTGTALEDQKEGTLLCMSSPSSCIVHYFNHYGLTVHECDRYGHTPLYWAIVNKDLEGVRKYNSDSDRKICSSLFSKNGHWNVYFVLAVFRPYLEGSVESEDKEFLLLSLLLEFYQPSENYLLRERYSTEHSSLLPEDLADDGSKFKKILRFLRTHPSASKEDIIEQWEK